MTLPILAGGNKQLMTMEPLGVCKRRGGTSCLSRWASAFPLKRDVSS